MALGNPGTGWAAFVALCVLAAGSPLCAIERVELPLFSSAVEAIPADSSQNELLFRLPEDVGFEPGSELRLILRATGTIPSDQFSISLSFNGESLAARRISEPGARLSDTIQVTAAVPEKLILGSWNRITLRIARSAASQDQ